tara:strand:+ start:1777 stop:1878 length:102 start_codon:yes stop_codon:yes gene_type:complete
MNTTINKTKQQGFDSSTEEEPLSLGNTITLVAE